MIKYRTPPMYWNKCKALKQFIADRYKGRQIKIIADGDKYVVEMSRELYEMIYKQLAFFIK